MKVSTATYLVITSDLRNHTYNLPICAERCLRGIQSDHLSSIQTQNYSQRLTRGKVTRCLFVEYMRTESHRSRSNCAKSLRSGDAFRAWKRLCFQHPHPCFHNIVTTVCPLRGVMDDSASLRHCCENEMPRISPG